MHLGLAGGQQLGRLGQVSCWAAGRFWRVAPSARAAQRNHAGNVCLLISRKHCEMGNRHGHRTVPVWHRVPPGLPCPASTGSRSLTPAHPARASRRLSIISGATIPLFADRILGGLRPCIAQAGSSSSMPPLHTASLGQPVLSHAPSPRRLGRSPFSTKQRKQAAEAADAEAEGVEVEEGPRMQLSGRSLPVRRGRGKRRKSEASFCCAVPAESC